jgi:sugar phosphate isomerase/epimerase
LKDAAEYAQKRGVMIALDGIWSSFLTHSPELIVQMIEDVGMPTLRHNFDPCYLELSGHDLVQAATLLGPYSVHAHVKDYAGRYPHFRHCIPGEGVIDHGRYIRALAESGFGGYVVSECFIEAPLERALAVSYQALAGAIGKAGNG